MSQNMEVCRDARGVTLIDHAVRDLRPSLRQLSRHAGFASTGIFVLVLGTAAAVTIFGFVDTAVLRPLPYQERARLVHVFDAAAGANRGAT